MRTRRRTYTAATPPSLLPEALPVSGTKRRKCTAKAKGNRGSKKSIGRWDLNFPTELLQEILSRLGLKANIQSSAVCKAWCEAAVSVRKLQRRPLLFNAFTGSTNIIELADPLRSHESQRLKVDFPVLETYGFSYSKDGWVLAKSRKHRVALFLNPFTNKHFYLPKGIQYWISLGNRFAFSAAPTSSSCVVICCRQLCDILIDTWRPGESAWTTHRFKHFNHSHTWAQCLFSNGVFYCLGTGGHLGVFDPRDATWNVLPVEPCPGYRPELEHYRNAVNMTEHEGDIYLIYTKQDNSTPTVLKLNLKRNVWEEKRDLGGLTVFTSVPGSFIRAGLSPEERNRIYPSYTYEHGKIGYGMYHPLGDGRSSNPPPDSYLHRGVAWVENLCFKKSSMPPPPPPLPPSRKIGGESLTNKQIKKFWRQNQIIEEEHLFAAFKAAARARARNISDYKRFGESLDMEDPEIEVREGIKDWSLFNFSHPYNLYPFTCVS